MTDPVEQLPEEEQFKVFWLQQHLYEEGIEGIHFTDVAREWLREEGEDKLERDVNADLEGRRI